jgi:hypothetical protein
VLRRSLETTDPKRTLTVTLKDVADQDLWSTKIEPRMEKWSRGVPSVRS